MIKKFKDLFRNTDQPMDFLEKNKQRFDSIISDKRFNYLEDIYQRLFAGDTTLADSEVLDAYFKFSNNIQTNTFAAAELELVTISVLCHFRPNLTKTLIRRGLLSIVYSLGDDIDWFTVQQFIDKRIFADKTEPYGGLPPIVGQVWLKNLLPKQKNTVQKVLEDVVEENRKELTLPTT
jgi:hypothetical protein